MEFEVIGEPEDRGFSGFSFPWDCHDEWLYCQEKGKEYSVFLATLTAEVTVYVDASTLKGMGEQEEYTLVSNYVGKNLPNVFFTIFFLDTREMKTCKSYWKTSITVSGEVDPFYEIASYFDTVAQDGGLKNSEVAYSRIRRTIGK